MKPHLHPGVDDIIFWFKRISIFTVIFMIGCYYDYGCVVEFLREVNKLEKERKKQNKY